MHEHEYACGSAAHLNRRTLLRAAGMAGAAWLTPVASLLAQQNEEKLKNGKRPRAIITLWMDGAPSQLDTFDPHPGKKIGGDVTAIDTRAKGIQLAHTLPHLAEQMDSIALVRNMVSREGDHERAQYNIRTGFRPDPSLVHPAIGAVICHQMPNTKIEIPQHVSILPTRLASWGGYMGDRFDAFQTNDPKDPLPDIKRRVGTKRFDKRLKDISVIDESFGRGRTKAIENRTLHRTTMERALTMMDSEQLDAFDISDEADGTRSDFGDTSFGRGCLAALRLVEVGVRCIEVNLGGWDSHVNNAGLQAGRCEILDPAFAALIKHLKERDLYDDTIVVCGGEFGRTPQITPGTEGREHWPHGFSMAIAGGPIRGGTVIGETDPDGEKIAYEAGTPVENLHATILDALGIPPSRELDTPVGRPIKLSEGKVIRELVIG